MKSDEPVVVVFEWLVLLDEAQTEQNTFCLKEGLLFEIDTLLTKQAQLNLAPRLLIVL